MSDGRQPLEIIEAAEETLATARFGLSDYTNMSNAPIRRVSGLRVAIVFGRAVTNVLEHLRSKVAEFDEWYKPRSAEMANDELLRYFYRMRTPVIKGGVVGTISTSMSFTGDLGTLMMAMGPPPPGTVSTFMIDGLGGSGFVLRMPDGSEEKHYITMAAVPGLDVVTTWQDAPVGHMESQLTDRSVGTLTRVYLDYMQTLIDEAAERFALRK